MSSFTFISYSGDDAGRVLAKILEENDSSSSENSDEHDLSAKTRIAIGFQPNHETEEEDEPEDRAGRKVG